MLGGPQEKPVPKRKLSRAEIQEIMERNIELYRNQQNLAEYVTELAMHLMEYEYDWEQSAAMPPKPVMDRQRAGVHAPQAPPPASDRRSPVTIDRRSPDSADRQSPVVPDRRSTDAPGRRATDTGERRASGMIIRINNQVPGSRSDTTGKAAYQSDRSCPFCGAQIENNLMICPSCRNLVQ